MRYFYFLFIIFFASCRVDEFSPCDDAPGMEGLLCKEFRFEQNASIGYLAYYYNTEKQLSRMEYKTTEGELKKYDTFEYENNKISKERSFTDDGNLLNEKKYTYNALQNLSNVYHIEGGVEVSYKSFEYSDTLLRKESNFDHDQLENYMLYDYYNDDVKLYRKSLYSATGELLNYTNMEYFVNNFERHNHYTGTHVFTGYEVFEYDNNGSINRSLVYDAIGKLISYIQYSYNQAEQLDSSCEYDAEGKLLKNNKFIYN